jgi:hypothetical protein
VTVYTYERCPFRNVTHAAADLVPGLRPLARATWPAARRAERVELTEAGIEAQGLAGVARIAWRQIDAVEIVRTPLGRGSLRISGGGTTIEVAAMMPGFEELRAAVLARRAAA